MSWFKKSQNTNKSRYIFTILAEVDIMDTSIEVNEDIAYEILKTRINKIEGDASVDTGIESNINFHIQGASI